MNTIIATITMIGVVVLIAMACGSTTTPQTGLSRVAEGTPTLETTAPTTRDMEEPAPDPTPGHTSTVAPEKVVSPPEPQAGRVAVPAPVESTQIILSGGSDLTPTLILVTGVPDACHAFGGYSVRSYAPLAVDVFNSRPEDMSGIACLMKYGPVETRVSLEGYEHLYEACAIYDVHVNGESYRVQATALDVRCQSPEPVSKGVRVLAPIGPIQIGYDHTAPRYFLGVTYVLPNSCSHADGYEVKQDGNHVEVSVFNLEPAEELANCIETGIVEEYQIPLEGLEYGQELTVSVNGTTESLIVPPGRDDVPDPVERVQIILNSGTDLIPTLILTTTVSGSCAAFAGYSVRSYDPLDVEVVNSVPEDFDEIACLAIQGLVETRISLEEYEHLYEPCAIYDVYINGESYRVQATAPNLRC